MRNSRGSKQGPPQFLKKGWLVKTGAVNINSMKRRFCIFYDDRTLKYFRSDQQGCLKGIADFSEVLGYDQRGSSFEVSTPGRVWQFEAPNAEEAKSWVRFMLVHARFPPKEPRNNCDLCLQEFSYTNESRRCILCNRECCYNCAPLQPEESPIGRFFKSKRREGFGVCAPCFPHVAQLEWLSPLSIVEYLNNCTYKWKIGRIIQDNKSWFRIQDRDGSFLDVHYTGIRAPRLWLRFQKTIQNSGKTELLFRSIYRECGSDKLVNEVGYSAILAVEKNFELTESIRRGSYTFPVICWSYKPRILRVQPIDRGARIFTEKYKFPIAMKNMRFRLVAKSISDGQELVQEITRGEPPIFTGLENERTYEFRVYGLWNGCTSRASEISARVTPKANVDLVEKWSIVGKIYSCSFAADGQYILTAGTDCQLRKWKIMVANPHTGKSFKPLIGHLEDNYSCICGPMGNLLYSGGNDKTVRIWDSRTGKNLFTFRHEAIVSCLAISTDGSRLVSGTWNSKLHLYDTDSGAVIQHYDAMKSGSVHCVCLTPHNEYVISGCSKSIIIWDLVAGTAELKIESAHAEKVTCLTEISEDTFASASSDAYLKMWTIDGELTHSVDLGIRITALDVTHDRLNLIAGGSNIQVINVATGRIIYRFNTPDNLPILSLATNPCDDKPAFYLKYLDTVFSYFPDSLRDILPVKTALTDFLGRPGVMVTDAGGNAFTYSLSFLHESPL